MHYNLLDENWIPVLYQNGEYKRVGIRKALEESGKIREIAASNPMDRVALLRFLLAVLLWCKDDLKSALATLSDTGTGIPDEWLTKLEEHKTAFDLLGDGERFYQDKSLEGKPSRPIADLLVEFPGADSVNHMRHVVHDDSYGFCPACCALGIFRLSVWAPANQFYPASVNPGSAAYVIAKRENLLLTLVANLPEATVQADQAPWLSASAPDSPGAVAKLAWRPRKLWLDVPGNGHCAYCGQHGALVKRLCIEKGWPTPVTPAQQFGKDVLGEFQKLSTDYKAKRTDKRKLADKVVKIAPVILKCRMRELLQQDSNAAQALQEESDAAKIARVIDQLYSAGNEAIIKELIKKPTKEEQPLLDQSDTRMKKFWVEDPHLLKETEAIRLPNLNANVALHASKFWRDALRLRGVKGVAIGIVGDGQYIYHDSPAVSLPDAAAQRRAELTADCSDNLRGLLKQVTPNPKRQHPEINAALVLLTPDTEAWIRTTLNEPHATAEDMVFLNKIYKPLVEQVVASTVRGSPLRRRAAKCHAQALLRNKIRKLVDKAYQQPGPADTDGVVPARPKRGRKNEEAGK